jgi:hypothetical protein
VKRITHPLVSTLAPVLLLVATLSIQSAPISGLHGTGVDASNNTLSSGAVDPHYTLVSSPGSIGSSSAHVLSLGHHPIGGSNSMWIGPTNVAPVITAGRMNVGRSGHATTLLPSGKVLAVGGVGTPYASLASAELYDLATGIWTATSSMNHPRINPSATLLPDGRVLVVGGDDGSGTATAVSGAELYNPSNATWTVTGPMVNARQGHKATLFSNGKVLVTGGDSVGTSAEVFDPATGNWTAAAPMTQPRSYHTATLLANGKVLLAGGYGESSADLYDLNGTVLTGSMNGNRLGHSAVLLADGRVLVAGGFGDNGESYTAEIYDPSSGDWTSTGPLETEAEFSGLISKEYSTAVSLPDGRVLLMGTAVQDVQAIAAIVKLYDPASDSWTTDGRLTTARSWPTATLLPDGKVLFAGGSNYDTVRYSSSELYTPGAATRMSVGRSSHTATRLTNGSVLVAGGYTENDGLQFHASSELYDPATGRWLPTGSMNHNRSAHTATLLTNGKVLVVGGDGDTNLYSSAELYNPATDIWMPTASMTRARSGHTVTLLPNGKVLVTGGSFTASAELYDPATDTWTATAAPSSPFIDHIATLLIDGKVLVCGGNGTTVEIFDPSTETWTNAGPMNVWRQFGHTATLLPDGKVLVVGGDTGSLGNTARAEVYDPATGEWSETSAMNIVRVYHAACLLQDGKVLVSGGEIESDLFHSEVYDPATGEWTLSAVPYCIRQDHTASLLPDGKVLVTGGQYVQNPSFSEAELYDPATDSWQFTRRVADGSPSGTYTFRTTFDLTGFIPSSATVTGQWAADIAGLAIQINEQSIAAAGTGSGTFHPFSITNGFIAGLNTLDFVVTNAPYDAAALRVDQLSGTATETSDGTPIDSVVIESRTSSGSVTAFPPYRESGSWFSSTNKSTEIGLVGVGSRFGHANNPYFEVQPTLSYTGAVYSVEITVGGFNINASEDIIAALSATGGTLSASTTMAFRRNAPKNVWLRVATLTLDSGVTAPTVRFAYDSGTLAAAGGRFYADAVKFSLISLNGGAHPAPQITSQPQPQTISDGSTATMSVGAESVLPASYQWFRGQSGDTSSPIYGANASTYTTPSLNTSAFYWVRVSSSSGVADSQMVKVTVIRNWYVDADADDFGSNAGTNVQSELKPAGYAGNNTDCDDNNSSIHPGALEIVADGIDNNCDGEVDESVTPPVIVAQPVSLSVRTAGDYTSVYGRTQTYPGDPATFTVNASGESLTYQWFKNGLDIPGATNSAYTISNATPSDLGFYRVRIVNEFGDAWSADAALHNEYGFLWEIAAADVTHFSTNNLTRGIAYNPASSNILVATRSGGTAVQKINPATGLVTGTLNVTGISGGTFAINIIVVTDDGVVYACNLAGDASTSPFRIYRWANESSVPTVAYSGNPTVGALRWGDMLVVRGTGTGTQIWGSGGPSQGHAAIFKTADGSTFTPTPLTINPVINGEFFNGTFFGGQNKLFTKHYFGGSLREWDLDAGAGTMTAVTTFNGYDSRLVGIRTNAAKALMSGFAWNTHKMLLYDISGGIGAPKKIVDFSFPKPNREDSSSRGAGTVLELPGDIYVGMDTANGVLALKKNGLPIITSQPQSASVPLGSVASFSVSANQPISYVQWLKDGVALSGQTSSTLSLSNVSAGDEAVYSVVVVTAIGAVRSQNATLTITGQPLPEPPVIEQSPQSETIGVGETATLTVSAVGTSLSYQWYQGNRGDMSNPISGATNSTYTTSSLFSSGIYWVRVSNAGGFANSFSAKVTVLQTWYADSDGDSYGTSSTTAHAEFQPAGYVSNHGDCNDANSTVHPTASELCNGVDDDCDSLVDEGAPENTFYRDADNDGYGTASNVTHACFAPTGYVAVEGDCDDARNDVHPNATEIADGIDNDCDGETDEGLAPVITAHPQSQTVNQGSSVTFTVSASGDSLSFLWKKDGADLLSQTSATLTLTNVQSVNAGTYAVLVSNSAGSVTSSNAVLTVLATVYDPALDFSTNSNPAGVWSYGYSTTRTGAMVKYTSTTLRQSDGLLFWSRSVGDLYPSVYRNPATNAVSGIENVLGQHPGSANEYSIIRFTAPVAGDFRVLGAWFGLYTTTTDVHMQTNGVAILSGTVNGYGTNSGPSFDTTMTLAQGATLDFVVGYGNNGYLNDSTGLRAQITLVGTNNPLPTIIQHPQDVVSQLGQKVTFGVSASPIESLTYQWRKNGLNLSNGGKFSGADTATLNVWNVQPGDAGNYDALVSNSAGSVTSYPASLTVTPSPAGQVVVWGSNAFGATNVPAAAQNGIVKIVSGALHSVALNTNGTVVVWGSTSFGISDVPAGAQNGVTAVAAGQGHTMALKNNGSVVAWGFNGDGQTNVPSAAQSGVVAVAAGHSYSLALKTNGAVIAWGRDLAGETSIPVAAQTGVIGIAAGTAHTVALKADGSVLAWGSNSSGQSTVPAAAQSGVVAIAAGDLHTLALKSNGSVIAWGYDGQGQTAIPASAQSDVVAIAAGGMHSVALKSDGTIVVWGGNEHGQSDIPPGAQNGAFAISARGNNTMALVEPPQVSAPSISSQPQSFSISAGATAALNVVVSGTAPLIYQWYLGESGDTASPIESANSDGYTTPALTESTSYWVRVSNSAGAIESSTARITVLKTWYRDADNDSYGNVGVTIQAETQPAGYIATAGDCDDNRNDVHPDAAEVTDGVDNDCDGQIDNGIAPSITAHPASKTIWQGAAISFSVTATGDAPLSYQWFKNNEEILDATNAIYSLASAPLNTSGSYHVVVSNPFGSETSNPAALVVNADSIVPTLVITSPKSTTVYTSGSLLITGTAADANGVAAVQYRLNNTGWSNAIYSSPNWNAPVELIAGTNVLEVTAVDYAGNITNKAPVRFFHRVVSTLTIVTNGAGGIVNATTAVNYDGNNTRLFVGRDYKLTARESAKPEYIFTNWTATWQGQSEPVVLETNRLTLTFNMRSNMVISANFIPNPFYKNIGIYDGLVSETNGIKFHSAGSMLVKMSADRSYSGKVFVDGNTIRFAGRLAIDGTGTTHSKRRVIWNDKPELTIRLNVDFENNLMTGSVSQTNAWTSEFVAYRRTWSRTNVLEQAIQFTNDYTMLLSGFTNPAQGPTGIGYSTMTVNPLGRIFAAGRSGDGQSLLQGATVTRQGLWPLCFPLYPEPRTNAAGRRLVEHKGAILGWLTFSTNEHGNMAPGGYLHWLKTDGTNATYTGGFTNHNIEALGSRWIRPTNMDSRPVNMDLARVSFSVGDLSAPFSGVFTNPVPAARNGLRTIASQMPYQNSLTATYSRAKGKLQGKFIHPVTGIETKYYGAILQDYNFGAGYFVGSTNSGVVEFTAQE